MLLNPDRRTEVRDITFSSWAPPPPKPARRARKNTDREISHVKITKLFHFGEEIVCSGRTPLLTVRTQLRKYFPRAFNIYMVRQSIVQGTPIQTERILSMHNVLNSHGLLWSHTTVLMTWTSCKHRNFSHFYSPSLSVNVHGTKPQLNCSLACYPEKSRYRHISLVKCPVVCRTR